MRSSLQRVKENPKFWHFWLWLIGLKLLLVVGVILVFFLLALSGAMSTDELDEVAAFLERNKGLDTLFVIILFLFAYRLATGTYNGVGLFLGKTWGTMLLSGLGILIVFLLVQSLLGKQPAQGALVFIGLAALLLSIFALILWPRKFFYQAVERAKNRIRGEKGDKSN